MNLEKIKQLGKCCISGMPLDTSHNVNMVQLDLIAEWNFPTAGNILTGTQSLAVAYIHDDMIDPSGNILGEIQFAVEFKNGDIVYRETSGLKPANGRMAEMNWIDNHFHNLTGGEALPDVTNIPSCSVCGCTDYDCSQCIQATGFPCWWVSSELCSRCQAESLSKTN